MKFDHATIVAPQLEALRHFFCAVVGLVEGERPPFSFEGYWLYQKDKPVIHLVKGNIDQPPVKSSTRIDHFAFRIEDNTEWTKLIERLQEENIVYRATEVPVSGELQLFVMPIPGVTIEFVAVATVAVSAKGIVNALRNYWRS